MSTTFLAQPTLNMPFPNLVSTLWLKIILHLPSLFWTCFSLQI